jgi:hypothetical protein
MARRAGGAGGGGGGRQRKKARTELVAILRSAAEVPARQDKVYCIPHRGDIARQTPEQVRLPRATRRTT